MHTSRRVPLLSGILACVAKDEHGRARAPARSRAFRDAFIQTNTSTQGDDCVIAQVHGNAAAKRHINDGAQGRGNSRPGSVACRAAAAFTSGLSSADDSSGISGDH